MSRGLRLAFPWLFALLLIALSSSGVSAQPAESNLRSLPHASKNLPYHGGPVMHQPTVYLIFWLPDGYHYHPASNANTDSGYENLQAQFIQDLTGTDYYSILSQYSDRKGQVSDTVNLGDAIVDTNPYPRNSGSIANPLLDREVRSEIANDASAESWHNVVGETEFIVYTAFNVQTCTSNSMEKDYKPQCTYRPGNHGSCGWHNWFSHAGSKYLYSVIFDTASFCHQWELQVTDDTAPNGDALADIAVDVTSHELFESVTDPFGNGWAASGNSEIGDKCSRYIGSLADDGGDIDLNGDPYIVQKEWSNADHGCVI